MKISRKKYEAALARAQITQKELCTVAGIVPSTTRRIGAGDVRPRTVGKIAEALGVEIKEILEDE